MLLFNVSTTKAYRSYYVAVGYSCSHSIDDINLFSSLPLASLFFSFDSRRRRRRRRGGPPDRALPAVGFSLLYSCCFVSCCFDTKEALSSSSSSPCTAVCGCVALRCSTCSPSKRRRRRMRRSESSKIQHIHTNPWDLKEKERDSRCAAAQCSLFYNFSSQTSSPL